MQPHPRPMMQNCSHMLHSQEGLLSLPPKVKEVIFSSLSVCLLLAKTNVFASMLVCLFVHDRYQKLISWAPIDILYIHQDWRWSDKIYSKAKGFVDFDVWPLATLTFDLDLRNFVRRTLLRSRVYMSSLRTIALKLWSTERVEIWKNCNKKTRKYTRK